MAEYSGTSKKRLAIIIMFYLVLVIALTLLLAPHMGKLTEADFRRAFAAKVTAWGPAGLLAVLSIQIIQVIIAFIPGEPVEILCGAMYGAFGGLAVCLAGCVIASAAVFYLTRKFGEPLFRRLAGEKNLADFAFFRNGRRLEILTFILFLVPGTPKDALTYIAALSPIPTARFLLIATFARLPSIITSTYAGETMSRGNFGATVFIFGLTALLGLAGLILKDRVLDRLRKREN